MYSLAILNLIFVLKNYCNILKRSIVVKIGNYSYGIFYVHYAFLLIARDLMPRVPLIGNAAPIYQLIQLSAILALSLFSIKITRKFVGRKRASKFLGF